MSQIMLRTDRNNNSPYTAQTIRCSLGNWLELRLQKKGKGGRTAIATAAATTAAGAVTGNVAGLATLVAGTTTATAAATVAAGAMMCETWICCWHHGQKHYKEGSEETGSTLTRSFAYYIHLKCHLPSKGRLRDSNSLQDSRQRMQTQTI